jgi:ribosomal RNA-processing protein 8
MRSWINEQLYTTSSEDALDMMRKDPTVFSDVSSPALAWDVRSLVDRLSSSTSAQYHVGFRSQTEGWPTSPVTLLTDKLSAALSPGSLIIDLGCGDAALAKTLVPQGFKVLSYDLVGDAWVTECDYCTGIPLPGSEDVALGAAEDSRIVDGAVCCLSLMGRNWMQGVREIARVLQDGFVLLLFLAYSARLLSRC